MIIQLGPLTLLPCPTMLRRFSRVGYGAPVTQLIRSPYTFETQPAPCKCIIVHKRWPTSFRRLVKVTAGISNTGERNIRALASGSSYQDGQVLDYFVTAHNRATLVTSDVASACQQFHHRRALRPIHSPLHDDSWYGSGRAAIVIIRESCLFKHPFG